LTWPSSSIVSGVAVKVRVKVAVIELLHPLPFRGGAVRLGPASPGLRRAGWGLAALRKADSPHPNPSPKGEGLP
jgi:hypothetical protein